MYVKWCNFLILYISAVIPKPPEGKVKLLKLKNWMFNFVSLLKYKRQITGYKLYKPEQRSGAVLRIIFYPSSGVYTPINWQH